MDKKILPYLSIIFILTTILYIQTISFDFLNWDDDINVYNNPTFDSATPLWDIWTTFKTTSYLPVAHSLFYLQWKISHSPHLFHAINSVLHLINLLLIFIILRKLNLEISTIYFITLIYAIHPMRVEVVAWITEQKNLFASIFTWLALINYLSYTKHRRFPFLFLTIFFYIIALLSKQTAFSLLFVLIALKYFILGEKKIKRYLPDVLLGIIGIAIMLIHWVRESRHFLNTAAWFFPLYPRLLVLSKSLTYYLLKTLFPFNLCQIYPRWEFFKDFVGDSLPVITVIFLTLKIFFYYYKKNTLLSRWLVFSYLSYLFTILPVAGLFTMPYMNTTFIADRYSYFPGIFIIIMLVLLVKNTFKKYANSILIVFSMVCIYFTSSYIPMWKEPVIFWNYLIKENPYEDTSYTNLSYYYIHKEEGNKENLMQAMTLAQKAIDINPNNPIGFYNYGTCLMKFGKIKEAEEYFRKSLEIRPNYSDVWNDLGYLLEIQGETETAIGCYKKALEYTPGHKVAEYNLKRITKP